jgi:hypothetical protein
MREHTWCVTSASAERCLVSLTIHLSALRIGSRSRTSPIPIRSLMFEVNVRCSWEPITPPSIVRLRSVSCHSSSSSGSAGAIRAVVITHCRRAPSLDVSMSSYIHCAPCCSAAFVRASKKRRSAARTGEVCSSGLIPDIGSHSSSPSS